MMLQALGQHCVHPISGVGNQCRVRCVRFRLIERRADEVDTLLDGAHERHEKRKKGSDCSCKRHPAVRRIEIFRARPYACEQQSSRCAATQQGHRARRNLVDPRFVRGILRSREGQRRLRSWPAYSTFAAGPRWNQASKAQRPATIEERLRPCRPPLLLRSAQFPSSSSIHPAICP